MIPGGPYSNGEVQSMCELAQENPMASTFTRLGPTHTDLTYHGHVAEQIVAYRLRKMRNAARRLEESYARSASRPKDIIQSDNPVVFGTPPADEFQGGGQGA